MKLQGSVTIAAPREVVWAFLTNPEAVSQCAPGVDSFEIVVPDKKFRAVASVGFGSVKASFNTDVEWVTLDPPNRAELKAHGDAPGSAIDVVSEMVLHPREGDTTELTWEADVRVMGTIASLASRLMGSVTKKLSAQFFECVRAKVES